MNRRAQEEFVVSAVLDNPINAALLSSLNDQALPHWYLTAGCVCQSVWNQLSKRAPDYGVADYDVFYFDDSDLSYEAEDAAAAKALALPGMPTNAKIEVRNQARVHLWYEDRFGVPCSPLTSVEDGIDRFLTHSMSIGVRRDADGGFGVYASDGLDDVLALTVRPNDGAGRRHLYEAKVAAYRRRWPELIVVPWPAEANL